jgi:hypothetical protein
MPSAAPAVLLRSPPRFTTLGDVAAQMIRRDVGMLCNFTLRLRHGREIAQPYRFWGLLGFPPRSERELNQIIVSNAKELDCEFRLKKQIQ